MIEDDIRNFNQQFAWEPVVENAVGLEKKPMTILLGMGGSHLGGDLLNAYDPNLGLMVHSNYDLPANVSREDLIIASSYSGNTEEVIDGLEQAVSKGFKVAVMASGGRLIEIAKEKGLPYIKLPSGLQPRMSLGFQIKALTKLLGYQKAFEEAGELAGELNSAELEERGKMLAEKIKDKIPVIYSSEANRALAYIWKVKFNESSKVPAFYNVFPEVNHNEINGFTQNLVMDKSEIYPLENSRAKSRGSRVGGISDLSFAFFLLSDSEDRPRIQKRMKVWAKLFQDRNFPVEVIDLTGQGRFYRLFSNLLLADWASYYLAKQNGTDPEAIPLVEEFKKLIK